MNNIEVLDDIQMDRFSISTSQFCKEKIIFAGDDNLVFNKMNDLFHASQTVIDATGLYSNAIIGDTEVPEWLENAVEDWFKFSGFYLMISRNLSNEITKIKYIPYEMCRLSKPDDDGQFNTIAVCDWAQRIQGKKVKATLYPVYDVPLETAYNEFGHTISIYYHFKATSSYYPTSRFSAVLQDCATEGLLQEDRYNALVNGSSEKIIIRTQMPDNEYDKIMLMKKVQEWAKPSGTRILLCNTNFSQNGDGLVDDYKVDTIPDNRKLLDGEFETRVSTNISKAAKIPSPLIQSSTNMFSGEIIRQSQQLLIFNTQRDRVLFNKILKQFNYNIKLETPSVVNFE